MQVYALLQGKIKKKFKNLHFLLVCDNSYPHYCLKSNRKPFPSIFISRTKPNNKNGKIKN